MSLEDDIRRDIGWILDDAMFYYPQHVEDDLVAWALALFELFVHCRVDPVHAAVQRIKDRNDNIIRSEN